MQEYRCESRRDAMVAGDAEPSLYRAIAGEAGGFKFLVEQQGKLAEVVGELNRCDQTNRMAFRRCQADVIRAIKPMCIIAQQAKGFEVRLMALESLTKYVVDDNSEMAALLGTSGLLEQVVNSCLSNTDSVGQQSEYLAALQIELAVASVVPEAPAHKLLLPNVVKLMFSKVDNNVEVRHTAMEVLTHLSFATYQRLHVAALIPESLLEILLESEAQNDVKRNSDEINKIHVAAGRASIADVDPGRLTFTTDTRLSDASVLAQVTNRASTNFSAGAREFTKMVVRSSRTSVSSSRASTTGPRTEDASTETDANNFNIGLLMANICDLPVPGAEPPKTFAQFAGTFWNNTHFFRGLGDCLRSVLRGEAWPVACDVQLSPLRIVGTLLHLTFNGFVEKLSHAIPPLLQAVMVCLQEPMLINGVPRSEVRVARLACVTVREMIQSEKNMQLEESFIAAEVRNSYYRNQVKIDQALEMLKDEEPAAGDLEDFFELDEDDEMWSNGQISRTSTMSRTPSVFQGRYSTESRASTMSRGRYSQAFL